ncbi:hypothetical protein WG66_008548 [Moniliophthora roreri]|nr:hypothetical protein WG66_008548 [Moniliophthora roreri]
MLYWVFLGRFVDVVFSKENKDDIELGDGLYGPRLSYKSNLPTSITVDAILRDRQRKSLCNNY